MSSAREATVQYEPFNYSEVVQLTPVRQVAAFPQQKTGLSTLQKWGYGALLGAMVFAGIQGIRCGVVSGVKVEGLLRQMAVVEGVNNHAKVQNSMLQDKIARYGSPAGVEEMARDRLGMVEKDEILVRLYPVALAQH